VPYRPSTAWFELNAGSALAGVLPASVQAAAVGSVAALAVAFGAGLMDGRFNIADMSFWAAPWLIVIMLLAILITTPICALCIAVLGVPVAFLLRRRLARPLGLGVALGIALATGLATFWLLGFEGGWGKDAWIFPLLVTAYALPGGLFYRQAVLASRTLSRWNDPEPEPAP
jgi:hypothetical protein